MDDLLARAVADEFWFGVAEFEGGGEEFEGFADRGGWLGFEERGQLGGDLFHGGGAHAEGHAFPGAEGVDGDGKRAGVAVDGGRFDEEGLPAARGFHLPIGQFRDLEFCGHGFTDSNEFASLIQVFDPVAEGFKSHNSGGAICYQV